MISQTRPISDLVGSLIGPIVWAAHFFALYGAETLICLDGGPGLGNMRLFAAAITAIAVGILLASIIWTRRSHGRVPALRNISNILSLISIGAIAATALPATIVPTCMTPAG
jgi:hypothetical protein